MDYSAGKPIGPTFADEIVSLSDRRFAWGADGKFTLSEDMAPADVDALKAIIAAHVSTATRSQAKLDAETIASLDSFKLLKAIVLWQAQLHGKTAPQARDEILAIYRSLS